MCKLVKVFNAQLYIEAPSSPVPPGWFQGAEMVDVSRMAARHAKTEPFWGFLDRCSEQSFCNVATCCFLHFYMGNTPKVWQNRLPRICTNMGKRRTVYSTKLLRVCDDRS
ncbi:unnamed protein product [Musa textilis]